MGLGNCLSSHVFFRDMADTRNLIVWSSSLDHLTVVIASQIVSEEKDQSSTSILVFVFFRIEEYGGWGVDREREFL